ncbi:MAG: hypothetical protein JW943_10860 [Deltaproteobacteria bacterium]|nr:hypothetical protein [Deltaproteobacteria bacterium]
MNLPGRLSGPTRQFSCVEKHFYVEDGRLKKKQDFVFMSVENEFMVSGTESFVRTMDLRLQAQGGLKKTFNELGY